jgi:hypothetical protein
MGRRKMPGLVKRGNIWHINKTINGFLFCESTSTGRLEEAEKHLVRRLEIMRQATVYGVRPKRLFREAATKFLIEYQHKKSIQSNKKNLVILDSFS